MKYTVFFLLFVVVLGCNDSNQENNTAKESSASTACKNEKSFGDVSICLAEIDGMTECYGNPKVEAHSNQFRYEGNEILGMYFNDKTYARIDSLGYFSFDDYVKVYAVKQLKGIKVGKAELDKMKDMMEGNYIKENWADIKSKLQNNYAYLSIGKPVFLESYAPSERIRSLVFLMKMQVEEEEEITVMTVNLAEVKERLIYYAYYLNYNGEESLKKAKAKSDYFGLRFTEEN
jgi:hypothetical protein